MDLENNTTLASGPDGMIDSSGAWFINLNSTITSRDNLRQGAADLINLVSTLPNLHAVGAVTTSFNSSAVFSSATPWAASWAPLSWVPIALARS